MRDFVEYGTPQDSRDGRYPGWPCNACIISTPHASDCAANCAARCACGGPRSKIKVDVFFSAGMPMRALARFSEYPRVFTYFEVSTVDVVGIYFLSHVLALILLHHPPSVLGENAGGKEAARSSTTSSRQHPRGNVPQFLPQDSFRDGRCPGCPLVAIFPSDIEFSPSKQTS